MCIFQGYGRKHYYIAAQGTIVQIVHSTCIVYSAVYTFICLLVGPLPKTVVDFWKMIWETKSPMVVMLTKALEGGKVSYYVCYVCGWYIVCNYLYM